MERISPNESITKKKLFAELHSEEVDEIMSRPPNWLVRWGITFFLFILIVIITATWLVRYPDIVPASFTLTAVEQPRAVVTRNNGKLIRLFVEDGGAVREGDLLAFTETSADPERVLELDRYLSKWYKIVENAQWERIVEISSSRFSDLGEVQSTFQEFTYKVSELESVLHGGFYYRRRILLLEDLDALHRLDENLGEQFELLKKEYQIALEEFDIQESLYKQKVIANIEYKREKAKLLSKEIPLKANTALSIQNKAARTAKQKEILELDNTVSEYKRNFLQTLNTLRVSIAAWKQRYVLIAPIGGRVSFSAPWTEQQYLNQGQELLTIEPPARELEGIVKIGHVNLGKVRVGQKVLIKLDGYPYREYGLLSGHLVRLSPVSGRDSLYWGHVELPNQLTTRYKQNLSYRNGMRGTAEIITADRRLFERLISVVRDGRR